MRLRPFAIASVAALMAFDLVVAWGPAAGVVEVVLQDDLLLGRLGLQPLPHAIARPQVRGRRERVEAERGFQLGARTRPVVEDEPVAVGGEHERDVQRVGVVERLLHAVADGVVVVLGLDQGDGYVGLVVEDVVSPFWLLPRLTSLPRTMMRPLVKLTSSRICDISSHPAARSAGVMNFVQMSRSESSSCPS